jgi:hypothetical protein
VVALCRAAHGSAERHGLAGIAARSAAMLRHFDGALT